jgi:hypothetical protein
MSIKMKCDFMHESYINRRFSFKFYNYYLLFTKMNVNNSNSLKFNDLKEEKIYQKTFFKSKILSIRQVLSQISIYNSTLGQFSSENGNILVVSHLNSRLVCGLVFYLKHNANFRLNFYKYSLSWHQNLIKFNSKIDSSRFLSATTQSHVLNCERLQLLFVNVLNDDCIIRLWLVIAYISKAIALEFLAF